MDLRDGVGAGAGAGADAGADSMGVEGQVGMAEPHSPRRWLRMAKGMARSVRTARSVSARSSAVVFWWW